MLCGSIEVVPIPTDEVGHLADLTVGEEPFQRILPEKIGLAWGYLRRVQCFLDFTRSTIRPSA